MTWTNLRTPLSEPLVEIGDGMTGEARPGSVEDGGRVSRRQARKKRTGPSTTARVLADEFSEIHGFKPAGDGFEPSTDIYHDRGGSQADRPLADRPLARWTEHIEGLAPRLARPVLRPFARLVRAIAALGRQAEPRAASPVPPSLVREFHRVGPRSALCLSGGGIRSAAFALGVLQWLARERYLEQFQYLSTVSGGGYIGAWLSAWIAKEAGGYASVRAALEADPDGLGEAAPIRHLRSNTRYVTQKSGFWSGDTWTTIAIVVRNLLANWIVFLPLAAALILVLQGFAFLVARHQALSSWAPAAMAVALACYVCAQSFIKLNRPRWTVLNSDRSAFNLFCLCPMVMASLAWMILVVLAPLGTSLADFTRSAIAYSAALVGIQVATWILALLVWKLRCRAVPVLTVGGVQRRAVRPDEVWIGIGGTDAALARARSGEGPPLVMATPIDREQDALVFEIRLSKPCDEPVAVEVFTEDRQAVATQHYLDVWLTLLFEKRSTLQRLALPVTGTIDGRSVERGDVRLILRNPRNASVDRAPYKEEMAWDFAGSLVSGALTGTVLAGFHTLLDAPSNEAVAPFLLPCLAPVAALSAHMLGTLTFVIATSRLPRSEEIREWLGRASGLFARSAVIWLLLTSLVLVLPDAFLACASAYIHLGFKEACTLVTSIGGVAAAVAALVGGSPATPATQGGKLTTWRARIAAPVASVVFLTALAIALTLAVDEALLRDTLRAAMPTKVPSFVLYLCALTGTVGVLVLANLLVNANRFSLHAMYRNRLVRAFLGASRDAYREGETNNFTMFDEADNIEMQRLWDRDVKRPVGDRWRPFHVINLTLNVLSDPDLSLQERKAVPFTVSPLWCGSAWLDAHRRASEYGGKSKTISLGTAMAISGAAVSPNMGYNSSPLISLILALFNMRLGWWFGNPANLETYEREGPGAALNSLLGELLGLTDARHDYVNLSDGGHFDNLGLYEMVRRRCHVILVSDAGHDPKCGFADLARTIDHIRIDFGIPITFGSLSRIRPHTRDRFDPAAGGEGFAIGTIDYRAVDGPDARQGLILYVKPTFRGDEAASVLGYAAEHAEFPHESTVDQWFSEAQFESYRMVGFETMKRVQAKAALRPATSRQLLTLFDMLDANVAAEIA